MVKKKNQQLVGVGGKGGERESKKSSSNVIYSFNFVKKRSEYKKKKGLSEQKTEKANEQRAKGNYLRGHFLKENFTPEKFSVLFEIMSLTQISFRNKLKK